MHLSSSSHTFIVTSKSGEINIVICRNIACMTPITWYEKHTKSNKIRHYLRENYLVSYSKQHDQFVVKMWY